MLSYFERNRCRELKFGGPKALELALLTGPRPNLVKHPCKRKCELSNLGGLALHLALFKNRKYIRPSLASELTCPAAAADFAAAW